MSSNNQETKVTTNTTENKATETQKAECSKDGKSCDKKESVCEKKKCNKFYKSFLFYFFLATGSVVSSYFLWKKYGKKH